jgi:hypothetical protein
VCSVDALLLQDAAILFELYAETVFDNLRNERLLDSVADCQNLRGIEVRGTTFQLALLHQTFRFISFTGLLEAETSELLLENISALIEFNYAESGFSYLEKSILPPDLDTLAATIAALAHKPAVLENGRRLVQGSWRDEFPSVFLAPDEPTTREYMAAFFCGHTPWHVEVLINAAIAEHIAGKHFLNICMDRLVSLEPINYWYIPSTFTLFRLAQLCRLIHRPPPFYSFEAVSQTRAIPQMREVFLGRRCQVLERFLYETAILGQLSHRPQTAWRSLASDDPVVYASIGFRPYRSRLMYEAIFMMALAFLVAPLIDDVKHVAQ